MAKTPKKHPVRNALALLALAALCIGVAELSVARFEDPALYESVTSPVRDAWESAVTGVEERAALAEERAAQREAEREAERLRLEQEELERQRERERLAQQTQETVAALELAAQEASAPVIHEELVLADPLITEFVLEGDRELLTGGNLRLVYYNQSDALWSSQLFGRDPIGSYGCGPTALAMAIASTVDETADPANVAAWAAKAGYCSPRSGSYLSIVQGAAEHYGLACTSLGAVDADTLYARLSEGGVIVALMGPGHFTGKGHFILLHGVTLAGEILVADPNSRDNSLAVWDPQVIVDELSASRHDGAPLWLLTVPLSL